LITVYLLLFDKFLLFYQLL